MKQEYTSANTSINKNKLPAIFKMVSWETHSRNLDYGGGKFDNATEWLRDEYDVHNYVYDPFNRSLEHNKSVRYSGRSMGGFSTATLSNVLNVIKEPEIRQNVLQDIYNMLAVDGTLYITVYEGDKSNEGRPTRSGFQLNRKLNDYLPEVQKVFPKAYRKGAMIVCMKEV